jgi:excisionase family DNA binding protein
MKQRAAEIPEQRDGRISVLDIARPLDVGRQAVYAMLARRILPGIRLGSRWMVTRAAFQRWAEMCGMSAGASAPSARPRKETRA